MSGVRFLAVAPKLLCRSRCSQGFEFRDKLLHLLQGFKAVDRRAVIDHERGQAFVRVDFAQGNKRAEHREVEMVVKRVHAQARIGLPQVGKDISHLTAVGTVAFVGVEVEYINRLKLRALVAYVLHQEIIFNLQQRVLFFKRDYLRVVLPEVFLRDREARGERVELLGEHRIVRQCRAGKATEKLELGFKREDIDGDRLLRGADIGDALRVKCAGNKKGGYKYGRGYHEREYGFMPLHRTTLPPSALARKRGAPRRAY